MTDACGARRPSIAVDETGNTGSNLLDSEQPVFVLASVRVRLDEAAAVLENEGFHPGREAHYTKLSKSRAGRDRILRLIDAVPLSQGSGFITAYYKRFMAVTMIVEWLFEEFMHRTGGPDLHERRGNYSLANLLYFCTPAFCGVEPFERCLEAFVHMMRHRSEVSIVTFYRTVDRLLITCKDEEYRRFPLEPLRATELIVRDVLRGLQRYVLDPAIPAFFDHAARWTAQLEHPFDVIHDASHTVSAFRDNIMRFTGPGEKIDIGHDDIKAVLPLALTDLQFVNSATDPRVQVADLFAGAARDYLGGMADRRARSAFWEELEKSKLQELMDGGVAPDSNIFPPEALEPPNPNYVSTLDQLSELLRSNS